ncbi:MAG: hypothetical protein QM733_02325 [Ilumatobacteraceae bacterium]
MTAITLFKMGGQPVLKVIFNQAFIVSFLIATLGALLVLPYAKRRPADKKASWGEAMFASMYAFGLMVVAFGICPDRWIAHADAELGLGRDQHRLRPVGHPQAHRPRRRLVPDHDPVAGDARHRRRPHPRVVLRPPDLPVGQVAEAWRGQGRHGRCHQQLRTPAGEEGLTWHVPTPTRR